MMVLYMYSQPRVNRKRLSDVDGDTPEIIDGANGSIGRESCCSTRSGSS